MDAEDVPPQVPAAAGPPAAAVHIAVRVVLYVIGFLLAVAVLSVQLNMRPIFMGIAFGVLIVLLLILHFIDRDSKAKWSNNCQPFSFTMFMGKYAAALMNGFFYSLLALNVIWAARWWLTVSVVVSSIYGVSSSDVDLLTNCGLNNPTVAFGTPCNIIAPWLARPAGLYIHITGAILALALGPFQLSESFRRAYFKAHKVIGYIYCGCVVLGSVGAVVLIYHTASGVVAAVGFVILAVLWLVYLAIGINFARKRNFVMHREWMIRQYIMTFAAVPFRFLPAVLQLLSGDTIDPRMTYAIGAWATLILSFIFAEVFVFVTRASPSSTGQATKSLHEELLVATS